MACSHREALLTGGRAKSQTQEGSREGALVCGAEHGKGGAGCGHGMRTRRLRQDGARAAAALSGSRSSQLMEAHDSDPVLRMLCIMIKNLSYRQEEVQGFKNRLTVLVLCFRKILKSDVEEEKLGIDRKSVV